MGALLHLREKQYELQYKRFYSKGKLNLKLDAISKQDAVTYIQKTQHRIHMRDILRVI